MSEGWGQDFDEDGNVIGDVPNEDDEPSFVYRYKYRIAILSIVLFIFNMPRMSPSPGFIIGAAFGSLVLAAVIVQLGVTIRSKL